MKEFRTEFHQGGELHDKVWRWRWSLSLEKPCEIELLERVFLFGTIQQRTSAHKL